MKRQLIGTMVALVAIMSPAVNGTTDTQEIKPCLTEDSPHLCIWDAEEQGNGKGRSFINFPMGDPRDSGDDLVLYLDD